MRLMRLVRLATDPVLPAVSRAARRETRLAALLALAIVVASSACAGETLETLDPELEKLTPTYERDVRPVLQRHCVTCHAQGGQLAGGVELDRFETAWANRVRNACTAIVPQLVDRYSAYLQPVPRDPPVAQRTCGDWPIYSMPTSAQPTLTLAEQLILVRWVATGAAR